LLAFGAKYIVLDKAARREEVANLNKRGAENKKSYRENGVLPQQYWLKWTDIKCLAIEWAVSIFVVSTQEKKPMVLKYLPSVSAPGCVSVNIEDMGTADKARGEAAVRATDIVLFYNGVHYNALTWQFSSDDEWSDAAKAEAHFNDEFGDDEP
jgi:hypothetical protein